jgi:antitoxin component YwqK of YwqJK toxin-antitoxin module
MKCLIFITLFSFVSTTIVGQTLLTNPNKTINGKKEGLWSEFTFCFTMDLEGKYHLMTDLHHLPKSVIAEGLYINNQKQGYWKEFWIIVGDSVNRLMKGKVKSVIEYKDDVRSGLVIECYPSGLVKALGQYENFPINSYDTLQVPDWNHSKKTKAKDTIIHSAVGYKPTGKWFYFLENGELYH